MPTDVRPKYIVRRYIFCHSRSVSSGFSPTRISRRPQAMLWLNGASMIALTTSGDESASPMPSKPVSVRTRTSTASWLLAVLADDVLDPQNLANDLGDFHGAKSRGGRKRPDAKAAMVPETAAGIAVRNCVGGRPKIAGLTHSGNRAGEEQADRQLAQLLGHSPGIRIDVERRAGFVGLGRTDRPPAGNERLEVGEQLIVAGRQPFDFIEL